MPGEMAHLLIQIEIHLAKRDRNTVLISFPSVSVVQTQCGNNFDDNKDKGIKKKDV